jgi:hypothetical protein
MEAYIKPEIEVINLCLEEYIEKSKQTEHDREIGWTLIEPQLINT